MSEFKPGSWSTRGCNEVIIFEVSDMIYGKLFRRGFWEIADWNLDGLYAFGYDDSPELDLAPIEKPKRRFKCWVTTDGEMKWVEARQVIRANLIERLPEKDFEV